MSLHRRTVDQHLRWRTAGRSQSMEDALPNPFSRPAHEAIVERLAWAIDGRRIGPATAGFDHMNNPADDAPIVDPRFTACIGRQIRLKPRELSRAQPKTILIHRWSPFGDLESKNARIEKPFLWVQSLIVKDDQARDSELTFYCRHIVSELKDFYPLEYLMLETLAGSGVKEFMDSSSDPDLIKHISEYGLIQFDEARRPSFAIPVVGRYIASERARSLKLPLKREIVSAPRRQEWLDRRKQAVVREARALQMVFRKANATQLFGGDLPAEAEKVWQMSVVHSEKEFVTFINTMNRSFVEAIEKFGQKLGKPNYLRDDVRQVLPELWEALHRIKIYRHYHDHLELNPGVEAAYKALMVADMEGKASADSVPDGWFVLQQIVLDELMVGIQCAFNRFA